MNIPFIPVRFESDNTHAIVTDFENTKQATGQGSTRSLAIKSAIENYQTGITEPSECVFPLESIKYIKESCHGYD